MSIKVLHDLDTGTITTSSHGSSANWKNAYDNYITGISITGTTTKTITLTQRDGGTISDTFTDNSGSGGITMTNGANNRVVTATGIGGVNGEAGLLFGGSYLEITPGDIATPLHVKRTSASTRQVNLLLSATDSNSSSEGFLGIDSVADLRYGGSGNTSQNSLVLTEDNLDFVVSGSTNNAIVRLAGGGTNFANFTIGGLAGAITVNSSSNSITIGHHDTSSAASVNNSGNTVIQDVTLDTYGHVTGLASKSLSIPTVNDATLTVQGTGALGGSGTFTANQSTNATISISHDDTSSQSSVNNSDGTVIQDVTLDGYGHVTALGSVNLDDRFLQKTYSQNWTRLGYGTSGTAYWHRLAQVTINGSYKDYLLKIKWTSRYNHGELAIHIHSDNDTTADVWDATMRQFGESNTKSINDFKYIKSGSNVQVWVRTPGWREFDYIRQDAVTEGTPTINWYKEGDSGASKQTSDPGGTVFTDHTPWSPMNDGSGSGLDADTLDGNHASAFLTAHPNISAASSSNNSGRTYIQDITLDSNGHVTGIATATETVTAPTVNNGTLTVQGTGALGGSGTFTANQSSNTTISISHDDTSSQSSVNNSSGTVIQDVTLDGYGHVTGLGSVNLDGRYYTESEMQTFFNRGYISKHSASNLAVGWYTIATNTGDRALGEFQIWDTASGDHQSVLFNASHHFGTNSSNDITVLANSRYSGTNFRYIRIKENSTYDGAALQVYVDATSNAVNVAIVGGNAQESGWVIKDWVADATDPGDVSSWSSFTESCKVDLDNVINGGMISTGEMYLGGTTTQYKAFHDNYHPNADKWTTARTLTLNGDVSGSVSWDGSGNATLTTTVANNSHEHSKLYEESTITYGASHLQWTDLSGTGGAGTNGNAPGNPFSDWHHHIIMNHGNSGGYYVDMAFSFHNDRVHFRRLENGSFGSWREFFHTGHVPTYSELGTMPYSNLTGTPTIPTNYLTNDAFDQGVGLYLTAGSYNAGTDTATTPLVIDEGDFIKTKDGGYLRNLIGKTTGDVIQIGQSGTSLIDQINFLPGTGGNNAVKVNGNTVWNAGNDGAGTGLDADLLDGQQGSYYLDYNNFTNTPSSSGISQSDADTRYVNATGDTMSGTLNMGGNTLTLHTSGGSPGLKSYYGTVNVVNGSSAGTLYVGTGNANASGSVYATTVGGGSNTKVIYSTSHHRYFVGSSTEEMRLESDGDLHVEGDVTAYSTTVSDIRLKDNVETIDNALDKVCKLRGVEYTWNRGSRKDTKDLGVIAQEVEKVLPEIVKEKKMPLIDDSDTKYKSVDYEKITAVLVEAVKEQQAQIDELTTILEEVTKQLNNGNNI